MIRTHGTPVINPIICRDLCYYDANCTFYFYNFVNKTCDLRINPIISLNKTSGVSGPLPSLNGTNLSNFSVIEVGFLAYDAIPVEYLSLCE